MGINLLQPKVPNYENLAPYIKRIDSVGMYSNFGPLNEELISRLSNYFKVDGTQIHSVSNATQGLCGALQILSSNVNESWELPSWTFAATAAAIKQSKLEGTFCDVDEQWRVIPGNTKNHILDVLPFGDGLRSVPITNNYNFKVIDGAASFDALKGVGNALDSKSILIISMHATKLLAGGEGGIVITKNDEWSAKFRSWTNYGFDGSRISINDGTNAKISEYTAAIALASLDQWEEVREKLLKSSIIALEISNNLGLSVNPSMSSGYATPYWIIKCNSIDQKKRFVTSLKNNSIASRDWWEAGCHKMPAFSNFNKSNLMNTELLAAQTLGLPFHYFLNEKDFVNIYDALSSVK